MSITGQFNFRYNVLEACSFFPANCGYPHQELHNFAFLLQCQVSEREIFTVYSSVDSKVVASRHLIPLALAYGATIHKAQGLTLDRVEVDCSSIFKPGLLGVAIGRARKKGS
jgi:hypothetical protein